MRIQVTNWGKNQNGEKQATYTDTHSKSKIDWKQLADPRQSK
jgi:hypothetical protein